jgi:putative Holliday junction resolvase
MMRILGVDYGTVRVGLALSDELGMLATPLEVVENSKAIPRIREIMSEKNVGTIVVGLPRNMDGSYGPKADEVRQFVEKLGKNVGVECKLWDERLTTKLVERMLIDGDVSRKRRKEVIDKLAAQQILQSYLDSIQS